MTDLILIATMVMLLVLARGYVWACGKIAALPASSRIEPSREEDPSAAPGPDRVLSVVGVLPVLPIAGIGVEDLVGLILAVALLVYLVVTLLAPERFR